MRVSKVKTLMPAPEAIYYYITSTVMEIKANPDGVPVTPSTQIIVKEWKKVGNTDAVVSSDLKLKLYTVLNDTKTTFGQNDCAPQFNFTAEVARGKDSVLAELIDNSGNLVFSLSIPVKRQAAATYEIIPSVTSIRADKDGNILTGAIEVSACKTVEGVRSICNVMASTLVVVGSEYEGYWIQYRIDDGSWTDCQQVAMGIGIQHLQMVYGVPASAVSTITNGIEFRLLYGTSSSNSVLYRTGALQVIRNGQTGERGKTGRYYYYDGYFRNNKEYTATDHQAPYVAVDWTDTVKVNGVQTQVVRTSYYMLIADTNKSGSNYLEPRTTSGDAVWEEMVTDFKWLIAEAIFTNFAKLGSAVFSGDWMISQHGTVNGVASTNFELFDANDPEGLTSGNFRPNYAVDLLTGRAYLNDAIVRGVLKVMALYTVEGAIKTVNGNKTIDLEDNPGNSYVLPGDETVYLPDPTAYEGLSLTILFSAGSVLAYSGGLYMAYYTGTTRSTVTQNGMSFEAAHSAEGLSVLTIQSIKAYGPNSGTKWVVTGQRGVLGIRGTINGVDNYLVLPDGHLLT